MVAPFFFSDGRISDTVSWMFHPRLYKTHPPTGRCSAGSAPRKRPFPAFSGTYPHLLCLLYYSGICRHFQVTMKFISGCFYTRLWSTRLWSQSSFLLSAPGGGDDDLLRRGVQKHITDNQLAFGRHVLERRRHHIGCAIGAGRQRVSYLSGSPLRRGKRRSAACGGRSEAVSRKCPDCRPRQRLGAG